MEKIIKQLNIAKIVIGVDPAVTSHSNSNETGIIIAGCNQEGNKFYILDDLSGKHNPLSWSKIIIDNYYKYSANKIVAEINNGGDIVESMLKVHNQNIAFKSVYAIKGKLIRAEPIIALYEQGKIFHIKKSFYKLEEQLLNLQSQNSSLDRFDALVWSITELIDMRYNEKKDNNKINISFL